jgi:hypothetical protein
MVHTEGSAALSKAILAKPLGIVKTSKNGCYQPPGIP